MITNNVLENRKKKVSEVLEHLPLIVYYVNGSVVICPNDLLSSIFRVPRIHDSFVQEIVQELQTW